MDCPRCRTPMTETPLDGRLGRGVVIDVCTSCHSLWFDGRESLQLTPGATLRLFRLIGEHGQRPQPAPAEHLRCPRCPSPLRRTQDMQRTTRFEYLRCPNGHGRLTSFFNFLREKDFIRPLTPAQIAELRQHLDSVHCSNCGAAVALAAGATCGHCGSALSMLDMKQAGQLVEQLQQAESRATDVDPDLALRLERARRDTTRAFDAFERGEGWARDVSATDVVGAGLGSIARWLRRLG